jgi:hypothetical protein
MVLGREIGFFKYFSFSAKAGKKAHRPSLRALRAL